MPTSRRARLSRDLKRAIVERLSLYDDKADLAVRPLTNSHDLVLFYESPEKWIRVGEKELITGAVVPYWAWGWRGISKDYDIENLIAGFFHFASQYVARGRVVSFIGALALVYERDCDYRSHWSSRIAVAPDSVFPSFDEARSRIFGEHGLGADVGHLRMDSRKQREWLSWVDEINGLDPFVHRAVYQYWRAISLFNAGYWEESVTAFDGLASVASQFANARLGARVTDRRSLATPFRLTAADTEDLTKLYNLRCDFGAHPSHTKWWDFGEIYESEMEPFKDVAKKLFGRLCEAERANRTVEPFPQKWSEWFLDNCVMLLDAVWFTKLRH